MTAARVVNTRVPWPAARGGAGSAALAPISASLVREARRRAGLTQADLATRTGTTQSDIARLESGRRLPTLERVRALASACGLDLTLGLRAQDADWAAVSRNLTLSVEGRWDKTVAAARFVRTARESAADGRQ